MTNAIAPSMVLTNPWIRLGPLTWKGRAMGATGAQPEQVPTRQKVAREVRKARDTGRLEGWMGTGELYDVKTTEGWYRVEARETMDGLQVKGGGRWVLGREPEGFEVYRE